MSKRKNYAISKCFLWFCHCLNGAYHSSLQTYLSFCKMKTSIFDADPVENVIVDIANNV
jgi:hypothetical protein